MLALLRVINLYFCFKYYILWFQTFSAQSDSVVIRGLGAGYTVHVDSKIFP